MNKDDRLFQVFMTIHQGLPRQGPGSDALTLQALALCRDVPANPEVLDIGCGPGMQTLVLAKALDAHITAIDLHQDFLMELCAKAAAAGLTGQVSVQHADMQELDFAPERFDVIWSEGAAYIMGVANALSSWRRLLRPNGYLGFSELVWIEEYPPGEVATFFQSEYPEMKTVGGNLRLIEQAGYHIVGHFTLPDEAWWEPYYTPLEQKLPVLRKRYENDAEALGVIDLTEREIMIRRNFGEFYSYEFLVARKPRD